MTRIERFVLYSIVLVAFVVVAVPSVDLAITQGLYHPNNFIGKGIEMLAEVPLYMVGAFACLLVAFHHPKLEKTSWNKALFIFFLIAAIGVSIYGGHHTYKLFDRNLGLHLKTVVAWIVKIVISGPIFGLAYLAMWKVPADKGPKAFCLGVLFLGVIACSLLLMQALKMIWLRPRYRTLVALQEAGAISSPSDWWLSIFRPQFFTSFKKYKVGGQYGFTEGQVAFALNRLGVDKWEMEEFYSFPSGHTMNFLALLSLCYLPSIYKGLEKRKNFGLIFRIVIYVLGFLVAFSRILRGAHNASDVLFGYGLALILFDLGSTFLYHRFLLPKFGKDLVLVQE